MLYRKTAFHINIAIKQSGLSTENQCLQPHYLALHHRQVRQLAAWMIHMPGWSGEGEGRGKGEREGEAETAVHSCLCSSLCIWSQNQPQQHLAGVEGRGHNVVKEIRYLTIYYTEIPKSTQCQAQQNRRGQHPSLPPPPSDLTQHL